MEEILTATVDRRTWTEALKVLDAHAPELAERLRALTPEPNRHCRVCVHSPVCDMWKCASSFHRIHGRALALICGNWLER